MDWTQKLKFHHLEMLVMLAEQHNLTRVAELMNITQPALSKWLTSLEADIGMTLFERHSKGLRLTPGGELLVKHARRMLNDLARSRKDVALFKGGIEGSLLIGSSPVATDIVSQAVLGLLAKYPKTHLRIYENVMTPLLEQLAAGQMDAVIGRIGGSALQLPLNYHVLYSEPICFVSNRGHLLASCKHIGWEQLLTYRWIVWPTGTPIRVSIDNVLVASNLLMPVDHIESGSMSVTMRLLQGSNMIGILSQRLAQSFAADGQITILDLPHIEQKGSVGVFWRQNETPSAILQAFLDDLDAATQSPASPPKVVGLQPPLRAKTLPRQTR